MSTHRARIEWARSDAGDFAKGEYSRVHQWAFDGGAEIRASASPQVVPVPWSSETAIDPEEAFVAALSSCHMLFFIDFARRAGLLVDTYVDEATGELQRAENGRTAITSVTLNPRVTWAQPIPSAALIADLHERAHEACFIANSVTTKVRVNQ